MKAWENNIRKVTPYTPGEQPQKAGIIKLNTNENPYPPSPRLAQLLKEMNSKDLRLYPNPAASSLVDALAAYHGLNADQVFVGVGSDDVLALAFLTFFHSSKPILFPDITYSFYDVWADLFQIPYETPALQEDFSILPEDYYRENGGVIFPNPNAPTGIAMGLNAIRNILDHNQDVVVIVDEAYVDFGAESALALIDQYENLLVVRTFSKSRSLAGLRIGYAMGNPLLIKYLSDVKFSFNSYTMNQPSLYLGSRAIEDEAYFQETLRKIVNTREWAKRELRELGFEFTDSKANFIFVRHPSHPAKELFQALRQAGIYVRHFDRERISDYLRITIGSQEEMETLIRFLKNNLSS
ncbi:MAG: histidinol-phosphate transaminase [Lachnospiraceae bacterium]|nr:histidinol-phosphate transaminase [Lachnospiraceae bacterium]MCI9546392.1 histidinol-phosphate transaminase [Lachnospiraceae bacterium]